MVSGKTIRALKRSVPALLSVVGILSAPFTPSALAALPPAESSAPQQIAYAGSPAVLTPGAQEAANLLGVSPDLQRLMSMRQNLGTLTADNMSDEELALRVRLMDKIMGASLEVRVVADRIDRELAWSYVHKGMLEAKRQRNLNYLFAANFMQGGILGTVAGCEFLNKKPVYGARLLLVASSVGLGLSTLSLLGSRSGTRRIDGETTMLAHVFDLKTPPDDHRTDVVLRFLNAPATGATKTRREVLIDSWKVGHYLKSTSELSLNKLAAYCPADSHYRENIGLIGNRIRMLHDAQWTIEQLDVELLDLLRAVDG